MSHTLRTVTRVAHDDAINAIAAGQHGVVSRPQLLGAGVPRHVLDHRVGTGRLLVVHPGVYRLPSHGHDWPQRLMAACLAAGPGAVASHRAAALLHQLDGIEGRIELMTATGRSPVPAGVTAHRSRSLGRVDVEVVDGIPRTRPARTLVDLAAVVSSTQLERALDDALLRRLVTCAYLGRRLAELGTRGRSGAVLLARLLAERSDGKARTESEFERRLLALLDHAGVPAPIPHYAVRLPDGRRAVLDFAWPELSLAIEADSFRHHSSRRDWERDRIRNQVLAALGWRLFPVTWGDLGQPERLLAELCVSDLPEGGRIRTVRNMRSA